MWTTFKYSVHKLGESVPHCKNNEFKLRLSFVVYISLVFTINVDYEHLSVVTEFNVSTLRPNHTLRLLSVSLGELETFENGPVCGRFLAHLVQTIDVFKTFKEEFKTLKHVKKRDKNNKRL